MDKSKGRWNSIIGAGNTAYEDDGLDYEIDYMADVDDQRSHHFNFYGDLKESMAMDYEPQRNCLLYTSDAADE